MTEKVFPFLNLTLPEDEEYTNEDYGVRIELLDGVDEFRENHRDRTSEFSTGYYHTANVYIEQSDDEAKQTANALSQILSFALWRDVTFFGRYPRNTEDAPFLRISTATFDIDNTHIPIIRGVATGKPNPGLKLAPFLDLALEETLSLSESERRKKLRPIWLFLEASATVSAGTEFLLLWVALESCANENYESYREDMGDMFTDSEKEKIQNTVLDSVDDEFTKKQMKFLENRFGQDHLYEYGIDLKIKIYLHYLEIGFDMDEIEAIIKKSKDIRNFVAHEGDASRLFNGNINRLGELRKILIYVIFRRLGVDKEMQERLVTPIFPGPEVS